MKRGQQHDEELDWGSDDMFDDGDLENIEIDDNIDLSDDDNDDGNNSNGKKKTVGLPRDRVERLRDHTNPTLALRSFVMPDKPGLKQFLKNQLGENRVPAMEYYSVKIVDMIPRPAREFQPKE